MTLGSLPDVVEIRSPGVPDARQRVVYGPPVTAACRIDQSVRTVRDRSGNSRVARHTIFLPPRNVQSGDQFKIVTFAGRPVEGEFQNSIAVDSYITHTEVML